MTQKLVIATHNQGKLREIADILAPLNIPVISAGELGLDEPEEIGETFIANALLKAHAAAQAAGLPALADDSGLAVDALEGAPGIYSARWAGKNKDFNIASERIYDEVQSVGINPIGASASFICVLALALPDGRAWHFTGTVSGTLTFPARGDKGFGYDPIFIPQGYSHSFAEMNPEAKHAISHRAKAFELFCTWLKDQQALIL